MKNYTPLHLHTHYSLLDGLSKPEDVAKRCNKLNMSSCAITDHGSISGCIKFFQTMKHNNIKPILGVELYISDKDSEIKEKENRKLSHMLLLSKNLQGWKNLIEIVSESNKPENYYYKPRLDINKLKDKLSQGNIIGMSGHPGSYLANKIYKEDKFVSDSKIVKEIGELSEIFGKDNFFVEVQLMDKENEYQQIIGNKLRDICNINKIAKISSIDAHYCERYDAVDQRILLCSNLKMTLPQVASKLSSGESFGLDSFFKSDSYHVLSHEEMNEVILVYRMTCYIHLPEPRKVEFFCLQNF